ncbi:hypothetical protein ABZ733_08300 [Streptomyces longwoodensis]|uniref:hypothetical protein n=1 Tax=Streptomyces longwoodensis TaxID=68231 RepID=UPI0033E6B81E
MTDPNPRARCGNDPRAGWTLGDRQAVEAFRAYLAERGALRDRIAAALTAEHYRRAEARTVASPEEHCAAMADAVLAALPGLTDRAAVEAPLSPDYQHPECGFHWHGRDGMDIPMRDGQPICPRCELAKAEKKLMALQRRRDEVGAECRRRGKRVLEQSEQIGTLERQIDEVRRQLSAEILRAGQAEAELRRMADETQPEAETPTVTVHAVPLPGSDGISACCGRPPCEFVGERVTHDPDEVTCPGTPADAPAQDDPWPVQEATRRYAEELRATPSAVVADGHTGWECDAGASLIVEASTPGPGRLGTHHGVIYACPAHRDAAVERIASAGYEVDPRPAPPGHRWNPWPCGHVTAHGSKAIAALTPVQAQQDGAQS